MRFNQSVYIVIEETEAAQLVLIITYPSSTNITVQVTSNDAEAIGEYCSILIDY